MTYNMTTKQIERRLNNIKSELAYNERVGRPNDEHQINRIAYANFFVELSWFTYKTEKGLVNAYNRVIALLRNSGICQWHTIACYLDKLMSKVLAK